MDVKRDISRYEKNKEMRNAYEILVGKTDGKRPLGKPRCKWVYIGKYIRITG
jgi:hypothetical protein